MVRISKRFLYWLVLLIIGFITFLCLSTQSVLTPSLVMTSKQAEIVKTAITFIVDDVQAGKFATTDDVLDALSAEIPSTVRDSVLDFVGKPSMVEIQAKLNSVINSITISE